MKVEWTSSAFYSLAGVICDAAKDLSDLREYDGFVWRARHRINEILACCESREERRALLRAARGINNARRGLKSKA